MIRHTVKFHGLADQMTMMELPISVNSPYVWILSSRGRGLLPRGVRTGRGVVGFRFGTLSFFVFSLSTVTALPKKSTTAVVAGAPTLRVMTLSDLFESILDHILDAAWQDLGRVSSSDFEHGSHEIILNGCSGITRITGNRLVDGHKYFDSTGSDGSLMQQDLHQRFRL